MLGRWLKRKKTHVIYSVVLFISLYVFLHVGYYSAGFMPLRPLYSAEDEARRLLKYVTSYHYMCNNTVSLGNRSHFPVCIDNETGIDLESKGTVYSLWSPNEFGFERCLASNFSFDVNVITNSKVIPKEFSTVNHTNFLHTILVPNDIHDFSRNSYNQRTFNDIIMERRKKKNIDILKIEAVFDHSQTWEILYYLIEDHMLVNVKQLHIAINIEKLEEDTIYHWYRCLYNLFYKSGMRLYHTAASSPLCLQVTMMESCVYWLSWIRDPGAYRFVMHPPADFGSKELEDERLHLLIQTPKVTCHNLQSAIHPSVSTIVMPIDKSIGVCVDSLFQKERCTVLILSNSTDVTLAYTLKKIGCKSVHMKPELPKLSVGLELPTKSYIGSKSMVEVIEYIKSQEKIDLISVSYPGQEWRILAALLDSDVLKNTTQLLMKVFIQDMKYGQHPVILRRMYSEIRRMESQGLQLFDSVPCTKHNDVKEESAGDCYKLGFMKHLKRVSSFSMKYMTASSGL